MLTFSQVLLQVSLNNILISDIFWCSHILFFSYSFNILLLIRIYLIAHLSSVLTNAPVSVMSDELLCYCSLNLLGFHRRLPFFFPPKTFNYGLRFCFSYTSIHTHLLSCLIPQITQNGAQCDNQNVFILILSFGILCNLELMPNHSSSFFFFFTKQEEDDIKQCIYFKTMLLLSDYCYINFSWVLYITVQIFACSVIFNIIIFALID